MSAPTASEGRAALEASPLIARDTKTRIAR
jgi:hypothetical protein